MSLSPRERAALVELARRDRMRGPGGLTDWIPHVSPELLAPTHLAPIVADIERSRFEPVKGCYSVPPRHGKTETFLHAIPWWLAQDPTEKIGYVSFSSAIAEEKSARALEIAQRVGIRLGKQVTRARWEVHGGGVVIATGIRNALTSRGFTKIIVDDPIEGQEEAESPTMREKNWNGFMSDVWTRRDPRGTSFFTIQTRWHTEDLVGRLIREKGWPSVNLPAIDDRGRALAPSLWPLKTLEEIRDGTTDYVWSALFQGSPVPRGGALFGTATYCERRDVPRTGVRVVFGLDGAYSAKSHADYSVVVVLVQQRSGPIFVADVLRVQKPQAEFVRLAKARLEAWPGAGGRWYTSTTEKGNADLMQQLGLRVEGVLATGDKFVRAQAVAGAWQAGRIQVPRDMPWTRDFVDEVTRFTGLGDLHDDQVDAFAAAYDLLAGGYDVAGFVRGARALG